MSDEINKSDVEKFGSLLLGGMDALLQAGELAAEAMKRNPKFVDQVCDKYRDLTPEFVKRMADVGLKKVRAAWVINTGPGARRIARLPYATQAKHEIEPVELLLDNGETLQVDVRNLTPDQAVQVFADNRIRSIAEQRAYLEDKKSKQAPKQFNEPFRVSGHKLIVMQPCQLTSKQLANILAQMG